MLKPVWKSSIQQSCVSTIVRSDFLAHRQQFPKSTHWRPYDHNSSIEVVRRKHVRCCCNVHVWLLYHHLQSIIDSWRDNKTICIYIKHKLVLDQRPNIQFSVAWSRPRCCWVLSIKLIWNIFNFLKNCIFDLFKFNKRYFAEIWGVNND